MDGELVVAASVSGMSPLVAPDLGHLIYPALGAILEISRTVPLSLCDFDWNPMCRHRRSAAADFVPGLRLLPGVPPDEL